MSELEPESHRSCVWAGGAAAAGLAGAKGRWSLGGRAEGLGVAARVWVTGVPEGCEPGLRGGAGGGGRGSGAGGGRLHEARGRRPREGGAAGGPVAPAAAAGRRAEP